jgi:phosphoglycerol transferase MdoB-like AlkP superfamily enzyme
LRLAPRWEIDLSANGTPPRRRRVDIPWLLAVVLAVVFILATCWLDGAPGVAPSSFWSAPLKPFLNALPGLLLALLLVALTRRLLLSAWLAWLGEALLYGVNALKVANLATPLMPADFRMLGQLEGGGGHLLGGYLPSSPWPYLAALGGLLLTVALARWEPPALSRRAWLRAALGALALAALVTLFLPLQAWNRVYDRGRLGLQPWSATKTAQSAGLISTLTLFNLQYSGAHHTADVAAAKRLIAAEGNDMRAQMAQPDADTLPDIVVVQSESFVDPGILKGYADDAFVPQLTRLEHIGDSGRLHIPTFGGGTIRTEFEVLTGISLRYFPDVLFPYLQFQQKIIPSLPRVLEQHGYVTLAVHANQPEFWNRTAAFQALGFQRFVSIGSFPADDQELDGRYVSDKAMTDEILRLLKDDGPPQFLFAISIEAHGPYDYNPNIDVAERDAIPVPAGLDGEPKVELQNYIYHMRHADAELGRLADALAKRRRPTLLMFYGDHLPALVPSYQIAGFDDGGDFFSQTVPWLLVEPNLPQAPKRLDHLAAWSLPGLLLARAGIHDEAYFALTEAMAPQLARLTRAPDAPQLDPAAATSVDKAMTDVAWLRLHRKLEPLLPAPAASAADSAVAEPAAAGSSR